MQLALKSDFFSGFFMLELFEYVFFFKQYFYGRALLQPKAPFRI